MGQRTLYMRRPCLGEPSLIARPHRRNSPPSEKRIRFGNAFGVAEFRLKSPWQLAPVDLGPQLLVKSSTFTWTPPRLDQWQFQAGCPLEKAQTLLGPLAGATEYCAYHVPSAG